MSICPLCPWPMPLNALVSSFLDSTYTSTGVRAPWVTEQQTAPANAKREYRATPESLLGAAASTFCLTASSLTLPVEAGGCDAVPDIVLASYAGVEGGVGGVEWS